MKHLILAGLLALSSLAHAGQCMFNPNPTPPGYMRVCMCDHQGNCSLVLVKR